MTIFRKPPKQKHYTREQMLQYAYIVAKNGWLAKNPGASPREVEAAMVEIARKFGV